MWETLSERHYGKGGRREDSLELRSSVSKVKLTWGILGDPDSEVMMAYLSEHLTVQLHPILKCESLTHFCFSFAYTMKTSFLSF